MQALVRFPGVDPAGILAFDFSLTHGISPSTGTLSIAPQREPLPRAGTLELRYGATRLELPDVRVDSLSTDRGQGAVRWHLTLVDRRWKWRTTGEISGFYNTRQPGTTTDATVPETRQSARELARLCLQAMGERQYDVSGLPSDLYPEVEWEYANPAEALQALADQSACRVVLGLDNRVRVLPVNAGRQLPRGSQLLTEAATIDPADRPDTLVVVFGRSRYQVDLPLRAVALEANGDVVPLAEASYAPPKDEEWDPFFHAITDEKLRRAAEQSAFRWYQITTPIELPGGGRIDDVRRVLPLLEQQLVTYREGDRVLALPAWVYGRFWAYNESCSNDLERIDPTKIEPGKPGFYAGTFTVEVDTGIVKFDERVLRTATRQDQREGFDTLPAELWLRCSVGLRDVRTRAWQRREFERQRAGRKSGTLPRYIQKPEVSYDVLSIDEDNGEQLERLAAHYLDAAEREYERHDQRSASYAGLLAIDLDGAIQQVTWSIGEDGKATTRASRNREEVLPGISYTERRLIERVQSALVREPQTAAAKQDDQARGRGI